MGRLEGKVAIVTGAAQGMGASHARGLAAEGAHVLVCDLKEDEGSAVAAEIGPRARFQVLDVTDPHSWERAVQVAGEWAGGLDVLVNNAGIIIYGGIEEQSLEEFRRILDVNLVGMFLGMKAAIPAMRARGAGSIINVASVSGVMGFAGGVGYGASKFAVRGLTKNAALDLAGTNIRVNCIHPGTIRTPMAETATDDLFAGQPIPRRGEPSEVTAMVTFLAGDDGSYCTGAEFVVDGGMTTGRAASSEKK